MNPHLLIDSLDSHGWDCDLLTRRHHGQDLNPDSIPSHLRYSTVPSSKLGPRRRVRHLVLRDLLHRHLPMSPFEAAFDPQLVFTYHCIDIQSYLWGVVLSNLVIDLAILYLPLPMVWKLQLSIRQKLALTGMFLLGLL